MKAVLCKEFGLPDSLVVEDIPSPKIKNAYVIVSVKACGVNFPRYFNYSRKISVSA